jgi:MFS family permease
MQAAGFLWIVRLAATADGYGNYVLPFLLAGVGVSMALPCLPASALNSAPPAFLGKAAGVMNTVQLFGATLGIALVTVVFNAEGSLGGPAAVTDGFRPSLAVSAGLSARACSGNPDLVQQPFPVAQQVPPGDTAVGQPEHVHEVIGDPAPPRGRRMNSPECVAVMLPRMTRLDAQHIHAWDGAAAANVRSRAFCSAGR